MWLAHALTLSRIPIAIAFYWAYGNTAWAVALIALAAFTDTADGNVARYMKRRGSTGPDIGGWLDPLVDKLFVGIVLGVLWARSHDVLVIALVGARELILVPLVAIYLARAKPVGELRADPYGKAATVVQFIALAIVISVPDWALVAAAIAAGFGLVAAGHYIAREVGRMHRYTRSPQREISITASSAR
ncbi:MAG TPA: CDP-alcohol phosphatidyltransferase family protein [Kofleriaceae bacterium]|nr:CDP-alcohol phosphatidyltransferase family protein [Kofleriaceae bacterium]